MQTCDLAIAKIRERRRADLHSFTNPARMSDHCTCQRKIAFNNFSFGDVLGSEGRKALNACVKVKIYGKPEVRRYDKSTASNRFYDCYVRQEGLRSPHVWIHFDENTKAYTIVDIHNALVKCDNLPYVEKYPKRETGSDEIRKLIDKRRADVEREWKEAKANPDGRQKYSLAVAQRRVKDCYAGNFPSNEWLLLTYRESFSIKDIYDTVNDFDERSLETCCYSNRGMYEQISEFRADVETKCNEFDASTGTCHKYTREEAQQLLQKCYCGIDSPIYLDCYGCGACANDHNFLMCIFDIRDALCKRDNKMEQLHKYPEQGPGSDELKRSIDAHRVF